MTSTSTRKAPLLACADGITALRASSLLAGAREEHFDRLACIAASLLRTPVALISIVDGEREVIKGAVGLDAGAGPTEAGPLPLALCMREVTEAKSVFVADAERDALLRDLPRARELGLRAYAGTPIVVRGHAVGSCAVLDRKPRAWRPRDRAALEAVAAIAAREVEQRTMPIEGESCHPHATEVGCAAEPPPVTVHAREMAHRFNNLLVVILGRAEFAAQELPDDHPVRVHLREITVAAERAVQLNAELRHLGAPGR